MTPAIRSGNSFTRNSSRPGALQAFCPGQRASVGVLLVDPCSTSATLAGRDLPVVKHLCPHKILECSELFSVAGRAACVAFSNVSY
jgi:hypothetical protein